MGRNRWTDEMVEALMSYHGLRTSATIAKLLNTQFGCDLNGDRVDDKLQALGLRVSEATGDLTLSDTAREFGIHIASLRVRLAQFGFEPYGSGKCRYVKFEHVERLRAVYPVLPEPTVSTTEAGRRLGYTMAAMNQHIHRGRMKAHRWGRYWRVPLGEVERVLRERARERNLARLG